MSSAGPPIIPAIPVGPVNMSHKSEKLLTCPYNKAHSILQHRMQTHLHKCRKQYEKSSEWGRCSHNGTHHMPRLELEYHEKYECANRHSFQAIPYTFKENESLAPVEHIDMPEPEEDWDDGQVNLFNPSQNAAEKSVFRGVHCVPPSERKAFKKNHRLSVQERLEKDKSQSSSKSEDTWKQSGQDKSNEPLRPPQGLPKGFRATKTYSEEVPRSPVPEMSLLSLESPEPSEGASPSPKMEWVGLGRGKPVVARAPPGTGAWGRGRPQF